MQAGKLSHRIKLQQMTGAGGQDSTGQPQETWTDVAEVWAAVEPIRGREYFAAQQVNAETTHRVRIRYLVGVTPMMRILFGARVLRIEAVINVDERNRELQLMCVEVV